MARSSRASTSTAGPSTSRKSSGGGARPSSSSRPSAPRPSCTPDYVPALDRPIRELTEEEQLEVVTQLMGFPPRKLLFDIVSPDKHQAGKDETETSTTHTHPRCNSQIDHSADVGSL